MSATRDEILRELGLAPTWRLREPAPGLPAADAVPATAPTLQASEPVTVRGLPKVPPLDARALQIATLDWPQLRESVAGCVAARCTRAARRRCSASATKRPTGCSSAKARAPTKMQRGEPFVGQAGKLLDNMLAAIRLKRGHNVYIANVVKCRPPGNRNPEPDEVAQCEPLPAAPDRAHQAEADRRARQVAAQNLLKRDASHRRAAWQIHQYQGMPLIVTYHPAYLLRSLPDKAKAWEDLCFAVETMQGLQSGNESPFRLRRALTALLGGKRNETISSYGLVAGGARWVSGGCGYNTLQSPDEQVKAAWAEVVNQYQRRADLVPNLVNTVKGFAAAGERRAARRDQSARARSAASRRRPSSSTIRRRSSNSSRRRAN